MTLTVCWLRNEHEDEWLARCHQHPAWRFKAPEPDKKAAEKSLKTFHSRHLQFEWFGGFS